jgi:M6 family metalloprotease-like protein
MRTLKIRRTELLAAFVTMMVLIPALRSAAAPACPASFTTKQPNGTKLEVYIRGDETQGWVETKSGYSIVRNPRTRFWEYASTNRSGRLISSGHRVNSSSQRPSGLRPHIMPARRNMRQAPKTFSTVPLRSSWEPHTVAGTSKLLVICVSFNDRIMITAPSEWANTIFDTEPGVKSVSNYYKDNSLGIFGIAPVSHTQAGNPEGVVSVAIARNHPDCAGELDYAEEITWINAALTQAESYVNFPALDTNGNGAIDTNEAVIYFIVAGYDASDSIMTPSIWAHAWGGSGVFAGGMRVTDWALSGELNDYDYPLPMGVMTHELGHSMCGLPDLYDTTDNNSGLGIFSLMSSGSWGMSYSDMFYGSTPVALDAWSRQYIGWAVPRVPEDTTICDFGPAAKSLDSVVKLIKPSISTAEYFLVENRACTGWDAGMEAQFWSNIWGGGLLVIHVDESIGTPVANDINEYKGAGTHQGVMVEEASLAYGSLLSGTSDGDYTHMFYDGNNSCLDDLSTPNTRLYNGTSTYISLFDISEPGENMTAVAAFSMPVADPAMTPAPGTYSWSTSVTLECSSPGAVIRYTLDGTDPSNTSTLYTSAIPITTTTTLKARAYKDGFTPSNVVHGKYTIMKPNVLMVDINSPAPRQRQNGKTWATAYTSINNAIKSAFNNSEIWVASGTYTEPIVVRQGVSLYGGFAGNETALSERKPSVNQTVLSGSTHRQPVLTANSGVTISTVVDGFVIRGGRSVDGGGIYCRGGSPTISYNNISNNNVNGHGGAIYCCGASPVITKNVISNNSSKDGGGIYCDKLSSAIITNNLISGNSAKWGAGIFSYLSNPKVLNNTIINNRGVIAGGGVYTYYCAPTIKNNIIAFCSSGICNVSSNSPTTNYNCLYSNGTYNYKGLAAGTRDIFSDPMLESATNGSINGESPCIDAGENSAVITGDTDISGNNRIIGNSVDIGAFEFSP